MTQLTYTGRRRYRLEDRVFRAPLLVLQVEIREQGYRPCHTGYGDDIDRCFWRDATLEDISEADTIEQSASKEKQNG